MTANYHTHTYRCNHATHEDERAYVEAAIKAGFSELGFADHTPMPLPKKMKPEDCTRCMGIRMEMDEAEGYVNKLLSLREEYINDINIRIGFEVEYIPEIFDATLNFLNTFPTDYIILGQHYGSVSDDSILYFGGLTHSKTVLTEYVDLVCKGIKTGKFTYVAHPDLCNYNGSLDFYEREMGRLIETAKKNDVPLEINLHGLNTARNYPNHIFWTLAGDIGCEVIFGSDAHDSRMMKPEKALHYAKKLVESNPGLHLIDRVKFKSLK